MIVWAPPGHGLLDPDRRCGIRVRSSQSARDERQISAVPIAGQAELIQFSWARNRTRGEREFHQIQLGLQQVLHIVPFWRTEVVGQLFFPDQFALRVPSRYRVRLSSGVSRELDARPRIEGVEQRPWHLQKKPCAKGVFSLQSGILGVPVAWLEYDAAGGIRLIAVERSREYLPG